MYRGAVIGPPSRRRRLFEILEEAAPGDRPSHVFDVCLIVLITLNIAAVVLETVPSLHERYGQAFFAFELFSVTVFTVEYILRLWVAPEHPALKRLGPVGARLRHVVSVAALVDLLAILPFYLAVLSGVDLRVLRVLRLLRFLKLLRYSSAMMTLQRVIYDERRALLAALIIMAGLLVLSSTAIYYAEREAQPDDFGSIPAAMWWALATLTTVGYGDLVPVTALGKMIGGMVMLFGLGMFALPVGIIAMGFSEEAHRRQFLVTRSMVARLPLFADLDTVEIARLTRLMRARRVPAGAGILRRGQPVEGLHFIATGEAEVEFNGVAHVLVEGDVFGETAVFHPLEDRITAVARSHMQLMVLDVADAKELIGRRPEIGTLVGQIVAQRAADAPAPAAGA